MTIRVRRVCLISPGHLSTNPRLVKEALALKSAGYHVHVVHGRFKPWGTANDASVASHLCSTRAVPFGPTEASRITYLRQTLVRRSSMGFASMGDRMRVRFAEQAHSPVIADLRAAVADHVADLYIAHYVAALPAAAQAAKRHSALYAFDAEDFHPGDLPETVENELEKQIIRTIEGRYLPGAAFVTAASPLIAEAYSHLYRLKLPTTVLNVFPKRNAPPAPTPKGNVEPGPSLYWFSQTVGPGRGLEVAIEAIARAKSRPHLYLRGSATSSYAGQLRGLAQRAGIGERIHLLDPAPPDELERLGVGFDLGYSGETGFSPNNTMALGNKLFSYLLGGIPSLASDTAAHRRIAPELGPAMTLFPIGDAAALAAGIDSLLLDPARLATARAHAFRLGQERFNWDAEQSRVTCLVSEFL